jgi:DNA polymerase-3 subunit epsilon
VIITEYILDTETTGLDPRQGDRIIEIGILEMKNRILTGQKFHHYVNPQRDVSNEAYRVHGISSEFLKNKPLFKDIADEFLEFIGNGKLVIHNAPFDIKFLNHELSLLKKPSLELSSAIDTLEMAKKLFPGTRINLDALCKRFKVDNSSRQFHGALKDAALLAEVYVELLGGRQVKFELDIDNNGQTTSSLQINNVNARKTVIVRPTKEELKLHKEFVSKIIGSYWTS